MGPKRKPSKSSDADAVMETVDENIKAMEADLEKKQEDPVAFSDDESSSGSSEAVAPAKKTTAKRKRTGKEPAKTTKKKRGPGRPQGAGNKKGTKPKEKKGNPRGGRFSTTCSLYLTKAFVHVTQDPKKGAEQRSAVFWDHVFEAFGVICKDEKLPAEEWQHWKPGSLNTRWRVHILPALNNFNACYRRLKKEKKSGWSDEDFMKASIADYEKRHGKFTLEECLPVAWNLARFDPLIEQEAVG